MMRGILGIIAGVIVGAFVVAVIEIPGTLMHPLPPGIDTTDMEALRSHAAKAPFPALIGVAIAWTAGPLIGCLLAAAIARRAFWFHALVVGMFFLLMDVVMIRNLPHPVWLAIIGVIGPIAGALIGASIAARITRPPVRGSQPYDMREKNMAC